MKVVEGQVYLTIGEVAKRMDRTSLTIKNWYTWLSEQSDDVRATYLLPEPVMLDLKGTRFFHESTLALFFAFRNLTSYGKMADTNYRNWGERGKRIHAAKRKK